MTNSYVSLAVGYLYKINYAVCLLVSLTAVMQPGKIIACRNYEGHKIF